MENVGNDGINLYNVNCFHRPWQQEQEQKQHNKKQQNYVIPQVSNIEVRL
jgi:xylose isomerase